MKYNHVIPLIGGMTIGAEMATGQPPQALISYKDFSRNDGLLTHNKDIPLYTNFSDLPTEAIDFSMATCPCAGLSNANRTTEGNNARGADAIQNDWMYKSAELMLEKYSPKVFWGENAPGLYTNMGEKVVNRLYDIAEKYGYGLTLYKTSTHLHGIPQKRVRTFYFFWKGGHAPIMNFYNKDHANLYDYLKEIPANALYQDVFLNKEKLEDVTLWKYFKEQGYKPQDVIAAKKKTLMQFYISNEELPNIVDFSRTIGDEKKTQYLELVLNKISSGRNYWDDSPIIVESLTNAITGRSMKMYIHPEEERFLNLREFMHLMGLPHDFKLKNPNSDANLITQNVPTSTARDMTLEVMKFIEGKSDMTDCNLVYQDNLSHQIKLQKKLKTEKLF